MFNLLIGGFGITEILVITGIIVVLIGITQFPKIARSVGQGLKEFKKSIKEVKEMDKEENLL